MRIASTRNPIARYVRSLDRAATRRSEGAYLVEGVRLVSEAIRTKQHASIALYDARLLRQEGRGLLSVEGLTGWAERAYEVEPHVLRAVADTETPAGVLAVLRMPSAAPLVERRNDRFGLILDGVADPGNAGTMLRSAAAFSADFVVTLPGSVDLFSPKVVRAGMGAHFRLPLHQHVPWAEVRAQLSGSTVVGAAVRDGTDVARFDWPARTLLVIGSEAHGVSAEVEPFLESRVRIPMRREVESLNAAVATSILLWDAMRKRDTPAGERYRTASST